MKREFLQNLQIQGGPLSKETVDAIMAENGRDIQKARAAFADYDQMKEELACARQELEQLRGRDFEALEQVAREWQEKYDQAAQQHSQELNQLRFDHVLQTAISQARGRNQRAITALLDLESLKNSENQQKAIEEALEQLKADSGYLFEQAQTPPLYARGTGSRMGTDDNAPATLAGALKEKYERK